LTSGTSKEMGIDYIPSHTNFMYYSVKDLKGELSNVYASNNIIGGRITEENGKWSRITIGTMDDMKIFLSVIKQNLKA
jgi:histidinol-phosphate aminotransferase